MSFSDQYINQRAPNVDVVVLSSYFKEMWHFICYGGSTPEGIVSLLNMILSVTTSCTQYDHLC